MSSVPNTQRNPASGEDINSRLNFSKKLQAVTNKIHATDNIDEIMLGLSQDICNLFNCDRLTIYSLSEDKNSIVSKVKTGLNSFNDLKLPISNQSIAGYVGMTKRIISIRDVYDAAELKSHSPEMHFQRGVDQRTGYRTKEVLAGPIIDAANDTLLGVVQLINNTRGGPFSEADGEGLKELAETLAIAFTQRNKPAVRTKYDALVMKAIVSPAEMTEATRLAREQDVNIEDVLTNEFKVKPAAIGQALSQHFGEPYEPYRADRMKPVDLLKNLKRQYVEQSQWVPIEDSKEGLVIMATDPEQVKNARVINSIFPKAKFAFRVTTQAEFDKTTNDFFGAGADTTSVGELLSGLDTDDDENSGESSSTTDLSAAADNELVKLVNKVIIDAYKQGASDIHIEPRPGKEKTMIRFRKDGSLENYIEIPANYRNALSARLKIMCDLDISERRKPQDGKIKFKKFGPLDIELRVATIPSAGGVEDIVMRILAAGEPIPLEKLGVLPHNLDRLKNAVSKPYGLFFVCGPTGSGKTTTLHSVLNFLNKPDTKIWTAEDPVEITQKGLRQVQVNRKSGLDFATAMRAFLRADPDVIMVGEMRDKETVSMGIEASLTGHLVFSTLHTNSAPESIVRLLDMGMDPFNFADALLGILAQRLAKRLCSNCKQAYTPSSDEIKQLLDEYCLELMNTQEFIKDKKDAYQRVLMNWTEKYSNEQGDFTLYKAVGCDQCNGGGYKGRVGLHELMIGTDNAKKLLQEHARVAQLLACALEDGMLTLKMDGIEKVLSGITDIKQVRAVCIK